MSTEFSSSDSSKEVLEEAGESGEGAVQNVAAAETWPKSTSKLLWRRPDSQTCLSCSIEKFWKRVTKEDLNLLFE